uniref:CCHC-type domain-containing protein n=1 Tax=Tanacetum cinerariifolium TaxID=118510 RepID=A0A699JVY3_TANCI|nr:hypothetical protein [Tanacetum cinerariifolium]
MLDAFTSSMCTQAWGRVRYARALIEISTNKELKQEVIMVVSNLEDMVSIQVEYEWRPPTCLECHVVGHATEQCPKRVIEKGNAQDKGYSNEKMNIGTGSNKNNESVNDTSVSNPVTLTSTNDAPTNTRHAHDVIDEGGKAIRSDFYEVSSYDGTKENGNPNVTSRVSTDKNMLVNGEHVNMENGWAAPVNEGRVGYARALIEILADKELKQEVIMAVPNLEDTLAGHRMVTIQVEYEWRPPICLECHVFGHAMEQCPKCVIEKPKPNMDTSEDGFTTVVNRKSQGKKNMEQ